MSRYIVEFSLALNNRTGKYFNSLDMIEQNRSAIERVVYYGLSFRAPPTGLLARVLGRLITIEIDARLLRFPRLGLRLRRSSSVPVLFTDPLQTALYNLKHSDVVIISDIGPLTHPQYYGSSTSLAYKRIYDTIAQLRPRLVFISDSTREAFLGLYGQERWNGTVIFCPIRASLHQGTQFAVPHVGDRFFLSVGAVGARKNQLGLIKAFGLSGLVREGFQLVIVGGAEIGFEIVKEAADDTEGVLLLGYSSEDELRWLYAHATGFALVSHLEGFGMPAAEALAAGLLPVLSEDPALREVAGDTALYAPANDLGQISKRLRQLASMSEGEKVARVSAAKIELGRFSEEKVRESWRRFFR